jgi:hypothetical protein
MKSSSWAVASGCLFLLLGAFLLFSGLMLIGVGINAMGPVTLLAIPKIVVAVALFLPKCRLGLIAGIVVGACLTAFWAFEAYNAIGDESNALGTSIAVLPLLGAAATLTAIASVDLLRRESKQSNADTPRSA